MRYYLLIVAAIAFLAYVHSDACVQCNSSSDPKCATNPEQYMAKDCTNTSSKCYTRVLNGATIRGCASDLDNATASNCNNELECLICTFAEGCNRNVFPMHRPRCVQCEGNSTGICATDVFRPASVCPLYKLGDQCYIRSTGKNATNSFQRGCLSTAQSNRLCINLNNCFVCDAVGCNNLAADSDRIPLARDSAVSFGVSSILLLVSAAIYRLA